MGLYKYINKAWKNPQKGFGKTEWHNRLVELRKQPAILRVEKPSRLDKARAIGYKAKQGIIVVRSRVPKGLRKRHEIRGGRRPKRSGMFFAPGKSNKRIAEERAARRYINMEVLNSYWLAEDGSHEWFEVILVNPLAPTIRSDKNLKWLINQRGRVYRGLTASGIKGRGLQNKGKGTVKSRPSVRAGRRKGK